MEIAYEWVAFSGIYVGTKYMYLLWLGHTYKWAPMHSTPLYLDLPTTFMGIYVRIECRRRSVNLRM